MAGSLIQCAKQDEKVHCASDRGGGRKVGAIRHCGGRRRLLSAGIAALAALGALTGIVVAVESGPPRDDLSVQQSRLAATPFGLPTVRPSTGDTTVVAG